MLLDFKITLHFHYGGKFEERHNKIRYVGEIGCTKLDYDYNKLSLIELGLLDFNRQGHKRGVNCVCQFFELFQKHS